jgi:hypothetical protein
MGDDCHKLFSVGQVLRCFSENIFLADFSE